MSMNEMIGLTDDRVDRRCRVDIVVYIIGKICFVIKKGKKYSTEGKFNLK